MLQTPSNSDYSVCWRIKAGWTDGLCSDQPGVAEVLHEDLVDEAVLGQSLNHYHPLTAQINQDFWDVQWLKQTDVKYERDSSVSIKTQRNQVNMHQPTLFILTLGQLMW